MLNKYSSTFSILKWKWVPENPQKANEDESLGTTSSFLYYPQELKCKVVQDKSKGTGMLIRSQCICKTEPQCFWQLCLVLGIPCVITFSSCPSPWTMASKWLEWGGSGTALFSGNWTAYKLVRKAKVFSWCPPFPVVFFPPCGLWAGIRTIDENLCPGGMGQRYHRTVTSMEMVRCFCEFSQLVSACSGYLHRWPAFYREML